jgi:plastocyanin
VVWWESAEKSPAQPIEGGAEMAMIKKEFDPRVLIVTPGTAVRFPNVDPILHNVFSVSGDNSFDLGLYRKGPGESYTFGEEGVVRVFCNVHHSMVGYVLVLGTEHPVRPDKDGRFDLSDLAEGEGDLVVWHERAEEPVRVKLTLPHEGEVDLSLKMSRARVPTHLNKVGRNYARPSDDY